MEVFFFDMTREPLPRVDHDFSFSFCSCVRINSCKNSSSPQSCRILFLQLWKIDYISDEWSPSDCRGWVIIYQTLSSLSFFSPFLQLPLLSCISILFSFSPLSYFSPLALPRTSLATIPQFLNPTIEPICVQTAALSSPSKSAHEL